jgi:hypothetical protein
VFTARYGLNVYMQFCVIISVKPVPVAARSKACVCGGSLIVIMGSNPSGRYGCASLVSIVCLQTEFSASG